jgi:hypothetical protein
MDCLMIPPLRRKFEQLGQLSLVWLIAGCLVWQFEPDLRAQDVDALSTRSMIEQWIQAEKAENKAKSDWKEDRQNLLTQKILLESEKQSLEKQLNSLDEKQVSESGERDRLEKSIADFEASKTMLEKRVDQSEKYLTALRPKLPPLLQKKIETQLPTAPNTKASETKQPGSTLVRRLQKLIGTWNEIHQFQNKITVTKQVIALVDSSEVEADVLYLGLAQGYFVTPDDQRAGIGKVDSSNWVWTEIPELGPEIRTALVTMNLPDPRNPATLPATLIKEDSFE